MMPQCPKPSCHQVMHDLWKTNPSEYSSSKMYKKGFAHTNNIINGGLECRSNTSEAFKTKVTLRSNLYIHYLELLGLSQSQIDQENIGDYSTLCYTSSSNTMQDYASCDVQQSGPVCSEPSLGTDQTICGNTVTLDAGVSLGTGETIKWYKNDNLISGANSITYQATSSGTYKAKITSTGCSRFDVITLTPGGNLQASSTNGGKYCANGPTTSVKINVTGGAGFYNFYKNSSGGDLVGSGSSLEVSGKDVAKGSSHTYYVEEGGSESILGLTEAEKPTENSSHISIESDLDWNNYNQVFTVYSKTTLNSIDFFFYYEKDQVHTLNVNIYKSGTNTIVVSKTLEYPNWGSANWSGINTVDLDFELEPGTYQLSTIGSKIRIWQSVLSGKNFPYSTWKVDGVVSLDGAVKDGTISPIHQNVNQGTFNWRFSSGSSAGCGRFPVTVTHEDCDDSGNNDSDNGGDGENSVENIITQTLNIYPNPASESVNVAFEMNTADDIQVAIYNAVGVLVNTSQLVNTKGDQLVNFDASNMSGGLYFVRLNSSTGSITKTISIVK